MKEDIKYLKNLNKLLNKENKKIKSENKKLKNINNIFNKFFEKANEKMLDYFISYYIESCRKYFYYHLCDRYKDYDREFEDFLCKKDNNNISYFDELKEIINKVGILNIVDEKKFYSNENIIKYYKAYNYMNENIYSDFKCYYLDKGFEELELLYNFKELNNFLDEKYKIFINLKNKN